MASRTRNEVKKGKRLIKKFQGQIDSFHVYGILVVRQNYAAIFLPMSIE